MHGFACAGLQFLRLPLMRGWTDRHSLFLYGDKRVYNEIQMPK